MYGLCDPGETLLQETDNRHRKPVDGLKFPSCIYFCQVSSNVKEQSTYFEEAKKNTCAPGSTSRQNKLKHM